MKEQIKNLLEQPAELEKLYRSNKSAFRSAIKELIRFDNHLSIQIWNERLQTEHDRIHWGTRAEILWIGALACLAALLMKLPDYLSINPDFFYPRNIGFVIIPVLIAYSVLRKEFNQKRLWITIAVGVISLAYINLLPQNLNSDTFNLACIHMPILLWMLWAFIVKTESGDDSKSWLQFFKFNGELLVMNAVILAAGGLMTAIILGLFQLIIPNVEEFYFRYIALSGLAASPLIASYLVKSNPQLVNKVSPVIAKIFSPLVALTLFVFLISVLVTGKDPYNDREFLLVFNGLLIGVMALIFFSISGATKDQATFWSSLLLTVLAILSILVNGVALSAIVFRITEWGFTPNRIAVLGSNVLILIHLILVSVKLIAVLRKKKSMEQVENALVSFLPYYFAWVCLVIYILPWAFGNR